jgi:pyruvate,water dikinase
MSVVTGEAGVIPDDALLTARAPLARDRARTGGKGANLARLVELGLPVPSFFVLGTAAFRGVVEPLRARLADALAAHDLDTPAGAEAAAQAARALILEAPRPASLEALVAKGLAGLEDPAGFVAVRSSAVGEDAADASFAGQMDTFLFVKGAAEVADAVVRCWASAFGGRALSYRRQKKLGPTDMDMAVVVQRMIPGEVSGVMFTANPTTGHREQVVVSATWGLGEGLVSGALAADTFTADKRTGALVDSDVQPKEKQVVWDTTAGRGTTEAPVDAALQQAPCLTPEQVAALVKLGVTVERAYGGAPQDLEWTYAGKTPWLLQTRPITSLPPPPPSGPPLLWDNSNIIESYSGVTSPLTFSYIRWAYSVAYTQSCELAGVPAVEVKAQERTYKSMLGLLQGCVFYNLGAWYRLLALFPGFERNAAHMESMLGVRESANILAERPRWTRRQRLYMLWCMVRNYWTVDKLVAKFQSDFKESYAVYDGRDWDAMELHALQDAFWDLTRRFLWRWQAPLVTDFCAMVFSGTLKQLTIKWGVDPEGGLQNDLLCGEGGIESTEPTRNLLRMAQAVRKDARLRDALLATADDDCLAMLEAAPEHARFLQEVRDYLRRWGFRCMNELKLEEPTLKDRPAFLFTMIKNYLRQPELDVEAMERREKEKRAAAEKVVAARLSFGRRRFYNFVLRQTRKHVKNRENMRFGRTRTYGLVRELVNAIGRKLVVRGELDHWHDVYYLVMDEVFGYIDGTTTCTDLRGLAGVRKAEFERYRAAGAEPDDRLTTLGAVHAGNVFRKPAAALTGDGKELRGTPCCPGTVTGKVRVILSPKDDMTLNGEILVAARTDPGWVPLYPSASGLLIERGSLLSHSSIVARELGLPTIVNIPELTARLKDGMTVTMDAGQGVVRVHDA